MFSVPDMYTSIADAPSDLLFETTRFLQPHVVVLSKCLSGLFSSGSARCVEEEGAHAIGNLMGMWSALELA